MTLKDLNNVRGCEIYVTAYDCDAPAFLLTDYLRGSGGVMSLEIVKLTTHNGLDLLAHIDISPAVLRILNKESDVYYNHK